MRGRHEGRIGVYARPSRVGTISCPVHTGREATYVRAYWGEVVVVCRKCVRWATVPPAPVDLRPSVCDDLDVLPDLDPQDDRAELRAWLDGLLPGAMAVLA